MYESPITQIVSDIASEIIKEQEDSLIMQVREEILYDINKEELIKALQYDRDQYRKGYADAIKNKERLLDLVKDVNPAEIAHHIEMGNLADWCKVIQIECERVLNGGNDNQ